MIHKLENENILFLVCDETGGWTLSDKSAGARWSGPEDRFGTVAVIGGGNAEVELAIVPRYITPAGRDKLQVAFSDESAGRFALYIDVSLRGDAVTFSYDSLGLPVKSVTLLNFAISGEDASLVLPVRTGLMIPCRSGVAFEKTFRTYAYEGLTMEMLGVVRKDAVFMASWRDPHVSVHVKNDGDKTVSFKVEMSGTAKTIKLHALGRGGYDKLGTAYREVAAEKGYLVTLADKVSDKTKADKLYGSVNFKMWFCMMRRIGEDLKEVSAEVIETFEEAGDAAEHLKKDLDLERVFFILGGWMKMGYDAQHPDILPAAPECGGTEGLKACGDRVKAAGYLFGLHDNYQDMYRDAPSWDEGYIMKKEDRSLVAGGLWLGGRAYITCSPKAIELAKRPQNLPQVKTEIDPDIYFIDTTYASQLLECYDKDHPLTQWDDMYYKQGISYYAKELFGMFGSECGQEWALPCAEWFEGITGVSGTYYHTFKIEDIGAVPMPVFEMAYHDCVVAYGKYHYDFTAAAEYVAHHASIGRTLNIHFYQQEKHRYWEYHEKAEAPYADGPDAANADGSGKVNTRVPDKAYSRVPDKALYTRGHNGWGRDLCLLDRFIKNTYELLIPLNLITTHERITSVKFLDGGSYKVRETLFGDAARVVTNQSASAFTVDSAPGGKVTLPPYGVLIECGSFIGFSALSFGGMEYESPVLFTLTAADGKPLTISKEIRVFHGFGSEKLRFRGAGWSVDREEVIKI